MAAPLPSRDEIVACLKEFKRPLHAGDIAEHCGVGKRSYRRLVELLDQLALEGTIRRDSGRRYRTARRRGGQRWEGELSVNPRGFGFVAAAGKPDVFIPESGLGGALHGDKVSVEIVGRSAKGSEGVVAAVLTRRSARVAGVVRRTRSSAWLEPDDARLRGPVILTDGFEDCADGDSGVAQINRFPETADENPEGEIVAILGAPGDPQVEVAKILVREQISEEHPPEAMQEAEAMDARARQLKLGRREDLREIPLLTIDPADARDHDDAVWAERTTTGYRVYIAIADVSEYVQPGTALDDEANQRGCTIYLPDRAIPMLPGALAADLCSLLPDKERYCLCVIAELDEQATVKKFRVVEGLMRGAAMITYDGAARALGFTEKPARSPQAEAFKKDLRVLASVTNKLRRARLKRGALDLNLPEPKIDLDEDGAPKNVSRRAGDPGIKRAYQIVEELMLLSNELVARWLGKKKSPAIYRVHGKPDEEKLLRLGATTELFSAPFDFEMMQDPKGVSTWLKRIQKHPQRIVLQGMLLRSLKQAAYDIVNIGHFGLASDAYLHFTSPIRRYPDLVVHRTLKALLRGAKPESEPDAVEVFRNAATHASGRERAAMSVEREVVDVYRTIHMKDQVGEIFEATVSAVVGSGVYVSLDEPFVEVLVRFESLGPDRYQLGDDELSLVGVRSGERIQLGDAITIEIEDVSILRRTVFGRRVAFSHAEEFVPNRPRKERSDSRSFKSKKVRGSRRDEKAPSQKGPRRGKKSKKSGGRRPGRRR